MENLKTLVLKLDREVWSHVPNPLPPEDNRAWTQSKAREESMRLISEYLEAEINMIKTVIDKQRLTLSEQYEIMTQGRIVINELNTEEGRMKFNTMWNKFHQRDSG